ncbi:MAG: hypothetical protein ACRDQ7_05980 [Haloechinothrix sp.]
MKLLRRQLQPLTGRQLHANAPTLKPEHAHGAIALHHIRAPDLVPSLLHVASTP